MIAPALRIPFPSAFKSSATLNHLKAAANLFNDLQTLTTASKKMVVSRPSTLWGILPTGLTYESYRPTQLQSSQLFRVFRLCREVQMVGYLSKG